MNTMKKLLVAVVALLSFAACNQTKKMNSTDGPSSPAVKDIIEVTGKVTTIANGKDGYTATIVTAENISYAATISIPNMTDPSNYRRVAVGETVTVSGELWTIQDANQVTVRKML